MASAVVALLLWRDLYRCPSVVVLCVAAMGLDSYGDSEVFARDWFGDFNPTNKLHTVIDGRWAYLPIMEVLSAF